MGKFKTVNELVNSLQPDYPVYCIRLNEIKKSVKFFKDNFPGKVLYAVKTNPNEKIIKQIYRVVILLDTLKRTVVVLVNIAWQDSF